MKEGTFYFSHDYNARLDEKIKMLLRKHGMLGYGIYWAIIEDLYNNANALRLDCEGIAFEYRVDESVIKSILNDFSLFVFEGDFFGSLSVQRRMKERESKSIKARESAFKRWNDANALPTHCEGNAIKEKKGNKKKGNESKEKPPKADGGGILFDEFSFVPLDWKPLVKEWAEYRKSTKKPIKSLERAFSQILKLSNNNIEVAKKIIEQSIDNEWQGLFEIKTINKNQYEPKLTAAERGRQQREQVARNLATPIVIDPNTDFFKLPPPRKTQG